MSLRSRLLAAVGAVALVALAVAGAATYYTLRSSLLGRVDQSLDAARQPIQAALLGVRPGDGQPRAGGDTGRPAGAPTGPFGGRGGPPDAAALARLAPGTFVEILDSTGTVEADQPAYRQGGTGASPQLPSPLPTASDRAGGAPATVYFDAAASSATAPPFRVAATTMANGDTVIVASSLADVEATLHRLLLIELAVYGAALLVAAGLGSWLVRVGLRPLVAIETTAEAIAEGDLAKRVPALAPRTEVGRLAHAINVMLGRIQAAFAERDAVEEALRRSEGRLRRFVADASHELRTPLAAVSAYAELFDRGADRRPEDLARVMHGIRSETARMSTLVEDLLLLARMDEGRPLRRVPVDLTALAGDSVHAAVAVGPEWPIRLEAPDPVELQGDPERLRQVVDNLLANVRAHTPPGTRTAVTVSGDSNWAEVRVADDGPGLPEGDAERVFERFYRVDSSRARSSGGAGLGLSIVAAIVAAHHGTVAAASPGPGGSGTAFTVRLPVAGPAPRGDGDPPLGAHPRPQSAA